MERTQRRGAGGPPRRRARQAQVDALAGVALALAVQRLMLAELLKQDHREQAARRDMEWHRGLRDRLTLPIGEALANR